MRKGKLTTPGKMAVTIMVAFAFALYPLGAIGQTTQAPVKPGVEKLKPVPHKPALKVQPKIVKKPVPPKPRPKPPAPPKVKPKPVPHKPIGPKPGAPVKFQPKPVPHKPIGPKPGVPMKLKPKQVPPQKPVERSQQ